jgi:hypothetical protein
MQYCCNSRPLEITGKGRVKMCVSEGSLHSECLLHCLVSEKPRANMRGKQELCEKDERDMDRTTERERIDRQRP